MRDCDRRADLVKRIFEIDKEAVKQGRTLKELQDKAQADAQDADLVVVNLMSLEIWSCIDTMEGLTNATSEVDLKEQAKSWKCRLAQFKEARKDVMKAATDLTNAKTSHEKKIEKQKEKEEIAAVAQAKQKATKQAKQKELDR